MKALQNVVFCQSISQRIDTNIQVTIDDEEVLYRKAALMELNEVLFQKSVDERYFTTVFFRYYLNIQAHAGCIIR